MRYGILADIHSNLEAFIEVKKQRETENIDKFICLGDIVGYGANPKECIIQSKEMFDVIIAGNHDWAAAGTFDLLCFNQYAREAVKWTKEIIDEAEANFLKSLPLIKEVDDFILVHGSLYHPDDFNYILNLPEALKAFNNMQQHICFIGHSHAPAIFVKGENLSIDYLDVSKIKMAPEKKYIINVGSVGQPRDGNPKACFCIYDTDTKIAEIKRVSYPVEKTQNKIINAGLPYFLATRLAGGR